MTLRIRFQYTKYPHLGAHSGYRQFIRHLDRARFTAELDGASDNHDDIPHRLRLFKPLLKLALKSGRMPWYKVSDASAELRALRAAREGNTDIIHFLDGEHAPRLLPRVAPALRLPTKIIATFHQPPVLAATLIDPAVLRRLDHAVLISPNQRSFFGTHLPEERMTLVLHGVDTAFFHPTTDREAGGSIRCLTVGHWLRDWAVLRAVATAFAPDREVFFDIVSAADPGLSDLPNVKHHSRLDDRGLAAIYGTADILFLPLTESTANNALLEAMASGLAIVTSDLEAVRAYLPADAAFLVKGNDVRSFVSALSQLKTDAALRRELGRRARARAERLSWPTVARQFEQLYERLAAARPQS